MKKPNHFGLASSVRTIFIAAIGLMASNYATAAFPDSCGVNMLFERAAYPDNNPAVSSATATFTSSTADQTFEVAVPASVGTDMTNNSLKIVDRDCPVQITSVTVQDDNGTSPLNIWTAYDGATKDGNVYNFPPGAKSWAGFANGTPGAGTFRFDSPGKVTIVGKIYNPAGQSAQAASVTVGGTKPTKGENDQEGKTGDSGIIFQYPFGGVYSEGENYTADWRLPKANNPTSGSSIAVWAGWASPMADYDVSTWRFPNGGKIFFKAKPTAGSPKIRFKFEKQSGNTEPAFYSDWIILEEGENNYLVDLPARPEGEAYGNFLLFMYDDGTLVSADITNLGVYGIEPLSDCPATEDFVFESSFGKAELIGHKVETTGCEGSSADPVYSYPADAETWGGFADGKKYESNYPLGPLYWGGGSITFDCVTTSAGSQRIKFKFEVEGFPGNTNGPETGWATCTAGTSGLGRLTEGVAAQDAGSITLPIPQGAPGDVYNNLLMYMETAGGPDVKVTNVRVNANQRRPSSGGSTGQPSPGIPIPVLPFWALLALVTATGLIAVRKR